jgi:hypothetical protein
MTKLNIAQTAEPAILQKQWKAAWIEVRVNHQMNMVFTCSVKT